MNEIQTLPRQGFISKFGWNTEQRWQKNNVSADVIITLVFSDREPEIRIFTPDRITTGQEGEE